MSNTERAEWLEWRRGGIGASDVAAIVGLSPWASPWSLWADKRGLLEDDDDDAREFGRWAEHMIAPWFEHRTGLYVGYQQELVQRSDLPWVRCSLDGRVFSTPDRSDPAACLGGLEMKTDWQSWSGWDEVPADYQAQGQWQMFAADLEHVWFPTLHGRRLEIYELERDDADIAFLLERADEFWSNHVVPGVPPEVDGSAATMAALTDVFPEHTPGASVELPDEALAAVADLDAARAAKKAAEADERAAKAVLAEVLGEAEEGTAPSPDGPRRAVTWRAQNRTDIDRAALKKAHPDIAEEFTKTTRVRVLRTHQPKETP